VENYIEVWRNIVEGHGWEETGWNMFQNPRYPGVTVMLYPRRQDGSPMSHKWEIRVNDKPYVSGMSPERFRSWIGGAVKRWAAKDAPEAKEPTLELTDADRELLSKMRITGGYITIPLGKLHAPVTKVAISVPELVAQTNSFSVKRRPGCTPTRINSNPRQLFLQYNVKCHESYSDPKGHDVRVKFDVSKVQETQKANDLDVQLSCSCPAFLYWGAQWNLHQRDGLLGDPRPELTAPTQKLDLRSNFVICKHCKAVLERILPSVQNNMITILREQEVEKNKRENPKETPERLQKEQDAMKKRLELRNLRKNKNKKIQDQLLEALRQRDEENAEPEVVERAQPAVEEKAPVVDTPMTEDIPAEEPKGQEDLTGMVEQEEKKLKEQQHKELKNQPHLHKGLPYETEGEKQDHGHDVPTDKDLVKILKEKKQDQTNKMKDFVEKKMKRKRTSLEAAYLSSLAESDDEN